MLKWICILALFSLAGCQITPTPKPPIHAIDLVVIDAKSTMGTHAPTDYALEAEYATPLGLCGFYVKVGETFHTSPAILYSRFAEPEFKGAEGIAKLTRVMADSYKSKSPDFHLEKRPDFKSKKGLDFTIYDFLGGPNPNQFESVAYLPLKDRIFLLVYSAKKERDFNSERVKFFEALDQVAPYTTDLSALSGHCLYPD